MNRRNFLAAGAGLAGALIDIPKPKAQGTVTVIEQTDWIASSRFLGEAVAMRLGYFEEVGINLQIGLGGPNNTGVAAVGSGQATLGLLSSSPTLMAARAGGLPIQCIAAGFQKHPLTFFSLPRSPIRTARDMKGKRIGITRPGFNLVQALMKKNGLAENEVTIVALGGEVGPLLTGQVDAISGWATDATKLRGLGPDAIPLSLWDTGVELYANPYYATRNALRDRPDVIGKMIVAISRGWAFARENQAQAIEHLIKVFPQLDAAVEAPALEVALRYVFNENTRANGWGTMVPAVWGDQIATFDSIGQFARQSVPSIDDVMTMSVLNATKDRRPHIG